MTDFFLLWLLCFFPSGLTVGLFGAGRVMSYVLLPIVALAYAVAYVIIFQSVGWPK
jgi:hypothetical protein